jgi:hypothetical protein
VLLVHLVLCFINIESMFEVLMSITDPLVFIPLEEFQTLISFPYIFVPTVDYTPSESDCELVTLVTFS